MTMSIEKSIEQEEKDNNTATTKTERRRSRYTGLL
jgi:hypothetical protein